MRAWVENHYVLCQRVLRMEGGRWVCYLYQEISQSYGTHYIYNRIIMPADYQKIQRRPGYKAEMSYSAIGYFQLFQHNKNRVYDIHRQRVHGHHKPNRTPVPYSSWAVEHIQAHQEEGL